MRFKSFIIPLWLLFATVVNSSRIRCENCNETSTADLLATISLRLYPGQTLDEYKSVFISNSEDLLKDINSRKPTVFYIHGWTENPESVSIALVVGAYLERQDHNIILVDYQELAAQKYTTAITSVGAIGMTVAEGLNNLVAAGLEPTTLRIVSHSLGSQIAGFVGRNANFSVPRITALDPAGPGFNLVLPSLTSDDAEFVDVILTDGGLYGNHLIKANVTFYPNGGRRVQPGCPKVVQPTSEGDFCSHHRSWYYYAESVQNESAFVGLQCSSYYLFRRGLCKSNAKFVMGFGASTSASGRVYLETNSESPFGRGDDGQTYGA